MKQKITELVKEAVLEIREKGAATSEEFTGDPIIRNNVAHMGQLVPFLGLALTLDDAVMDAIRTLMVLSYQTGIRVGRKQVMDEYLGKLEVEPKDDDDEIGGLD